MCGPHAPRRRCRMSAWRFFSSSPSTSSRATSCSGGVTSTGRIDLATFYAHRARRLPPAANLTHVLLDRRAGWGPGGGESGVGTGKGRWKGAGADCPRPVKYPLIARRHRRPTRNKALGQDFEHVIISPTYVSEHPRPGLQKKAAPLLTPNLGARAGGPWACQRADPALSHLLPRLCPHRAQQRLARVNAKLCLCCARAKPAGQVEHGEERQGVASGGGPLVRHRWGQA